MFGLATTMRMTLWNKYWFRIRNDVIYLEGDLRYDNLFIAETCNDKAWYLLNSIEAQRALHDLIIRKTLCTIQIIGYGINQVFKTNFNIQDCWEMILNPDIVIIHDPIKTDVQVINTNKLTISQYLNTRLLCGNIRMVM